MVQKNKVKDIGKLSDEALDALIMKVAQDWIAKKEKSKNINRYQPDEIYQIKDDYKLISPYSKTTPHKNF